MKDNKDEENENKIMNFLDISSRLVIKNIPDNLSDTKLIEIIKKNFEDHVKKDILICKLEKKYSMKGRNKICYITVDNLETRNKVYEFFSTFELVDPRGIKQKLSVNDAIYQSRTKSIDDPICNTIDSCEHFLKFKEYFSNERFVDFKNDESKFCDNLFDGETVTNNNNVSKENKNNLIPSKMIIIKKDNNNVQNDIINNEVQENQIENIIVDNNNNNNKNRYGNNKIRNYNNNYYDKGNYKDNYYNNKKDKYYNNDYNNNYENHNNKKDNYHNYDYNNNYEPHNKKDNYHNNDYNNNYNNNYDYNYYGKYNNYNKKNGYRNKGYK